MKNLDANTIKLSGRHIIEASAGTGKTFNITTLYIRLLLEKRLLPKDILVMTFTKDATQEIIGRVEAKIRDVLTKHKKAKEAKEKDIEVSEDILSDEDYKHIKRALLEVDEASIFTIHGFCKKVLSEQAFASGLEMDISMEVDTSDILQKVVESYFRKNVNKNKTNFDYLKTYGCHTPEKFLGKDGLSNIVKSDYEIVIDKPISNEEFNIQKKYQLDIFKSNSDIVDEFLSNLGKGEPEGKRIEEYQKILHWLELDGEAPFPQDISIIANGNKIKSAKIKPIFIGVKELKEFQSTILKSRANVFVQNTCLYIREDFKKAKEQKGVLDFNDLISKLCESVKQSPDLVKNLQQQFPVALIDEFQDTDSQQYEILDTIYSLINNSHSGLDLESAESDSKDLLFLMIGDPKQAIYGFRGGDIFTYLKAKDSCISSKEDDNQQWSMDTNWRSTKEMIKAYNRLFYMTDYTDAGVTAEGVFSEGIDYQTVKASLKADDKAKKFGDNLKPINYFYYKVDEEDNKASIDRALSNWTANEIVRLLNLGNASQKDIAILVQNGKQATAIQKALKTKNLKSVYLSERDNVYKSIEAKEILSVMEGLHNLESRTSLKKALSTTLLGGHVSEFIKYQDDENIEQWDEQINQAKELRKIWAKQGFMALIMKLLHSRYTQRSDNKERTITNILHIAELVKIAENKYKHPSQLIKWYRQQIDSSNQAEGELRLESDDNLIKIVTIHGSKGLEYSVVFIPFASYVSSKAFQAKKFSKYYDSSLKQTVYKIGEDDNVKQAVKKESVDELKRLFYVAVTRAEHRCYIGAADYGRSGESSPLAQFLGYSSGDLWLEKIQTITNDHANQSSVLSVNDSQEYILKKTKQKDIEKTLEAAEINMPKDDNWQMLSYSRISKNNTVYTGLEKDIDEVDDESLKLVNKPKLEFRFAAKKGADIGNIMHNVLEHTDFATKCIDDQLLQQEMDRYKVVEKEDKQELKSWLEQCLVAPITEISSSQIFSLSDIDNSKTLKEAEFYFPISNNSLMKSKIFDVLGEYRHQNIDTNIFNEKIYGMLHGFIDLIFEYNGKYYVADYKSNHLGDKLEDYNQAAMSEKNQSSFYDLQYLIYTVALDRYLEQNLANYSYDTHFGGVYYLYLRGMKDGYGVYQARPSKAIIYKLNQTFAGDDNV